MCRYPLGHGDKSLVNEPIFAKLAEKYGKTPAQIILKWHNQMGFIVIPGSRNPEYIKENADIFDFKFTDDGMAEIAKLDKGIRYYNGGEVELKQYATRQPEYEKCAPVAHRQTNSHSHYAS